MSNEARGRAWEYYEKHFRTCSGGTATRYEFTPIQITSGVLVDTIVDAARAEVIRELERRLLSTACRHDGDTLRKRIAELRAQEGRHERLWCVRNLFRLRKRVHGVSQSNR